MVNIQNFLKYFSIHFFHNCYLLILSFYTVILPAYRWIFGQAGPRLDFRFSRLSRISYLLLTSLTSPGQGLAGAPAPLENNHDKSAGSVATSPVARSTRTEGLSTFPHLSSVSAHFYELVSLWHDHQNTCHTHVKPWCRFISVFLTVVEVHKFEEVCQYRSQIKISW